MENSIIDLKKIAKEIRYNIVNMVYMAGDGHPGPALGITDIIATLYFKEMNIDPQNPTMKNRDRLILSKGHACPAVYSALAMKGYFPVEELVTLRKFGSILQGHPSYGKTPGIDYTSGSLGNGLAVGLGMEITRQKLAENWYTYVILGDGELNEGVVWEGAMAAVTNKAENLIAFVDKNGFQSGGTTAEVSGESSLFDKWKAFGWHVQEINGNDLEEIACAIALAKKTKNQPSVIISNTTKGKGVSFMENNNDWHKGVPTKEQWEIAVSELKGEEHE